MKTTLAMNPVEETLRKALADAAERHATFLEIALAAADPRNCAAVPLARSAAVEMHELQMIITARERLASGALGARRLRRRWSAASDLRRAK
jgi:hypothetical protein